jgi:hypothetical protein
MTFDEIKKLIQHKEELAFNIKEKSYDKCKTQRDFLEHEKARNWQVKIDMAWSIYHAEENSEECEKRIKAIFLS